MSVWRQLYSMTMDGIKDFDSYFIRELETAHYINDDVRMEISLQDENIEEIKRMFDKQDVCVEDNTMYYYGYKIPVTHNNDVTPYILLRIDGLYTYKYEVIVKNGKYKVCVFRQES